MKNTSRKNFTERNNKKFNKRSATKNLSKNNNNSLKNSDLERKSPKNKNQSSKSNFNSKNLGKSPSTRRLISYESNSENKYQNFSNKKSFEDWVWGKHAVFSTLNSDRPINRVWCTSEIFSSEKFFILLKELKSNGVLIEEVSWNRLSQLTFGASHQGVVLQLASSKSLPFNKFIDLIFKSATNPIILALDGITDPHNLGAIIRSAEAFGCKGIILPQRRSSGLTGTVAKVAAGALEHIPVSRVVNLNRALDELKRIGFLTVGLSGDAQLPISKFHENSPLVVIVGSEDKGISLLTQKKCDFLVKIPLRGKTSSLNASVAAAISLFYITNK